MKLCYIQETCQEFKPPFNFPPNQDVRSKHVCQKSLEGCDMDIKLRLWHNEVIACNLEEVREKKEQIKRKVKY